MLRFQLCPITSYYLWVAALGSQLEAYTQMFPKRKEDVRLFPPMILPNISCWAWGLCVWLPELLLLFCSVSLTMLSLSPAEHDGLSSPTGPTSLPAFSYGFQWQLRPLERTLCCSGLYTVKGDPWNTQIQGSDQTSRIRSLLRCKVEAQIKILEQFLCLGLEMSTQVF